MSIWQNSTENYRESISMYHLCGAMLHHRAKISNYAIQPPGRATGLIGARRALELWLEDASSEDSETDVAIIDNHNGQKDMAELLRYRRRKK